MNTDTPESLTACYDDEHGEPCVPLTIAIKLERERDEAREELRKASVEANTLATSIQKAEYPDAKDFELLGSVAGVISQIDNMYAGVRQQRDEARDEALSDLKFRRELYALLAERCDRRTVELAETRVQRDRLAEALQDLIESCNCIDSVDFMPVSMPEAFEKAQQSLQSLTHKP